LETVQAKPFIEYELCPELQNLYESGRVIRYHANPYMSIFGQTDADHQWGCAALLFKLHPDPSLELIKAAIFHDAGERWAGDMPYPAKVANPKLSAAHTILEHQMATDAGIPIYDLTQDEKVWLKFVDRLESHFFTMVSRPEIVATSGFAEQARMVKEQSIMLGVWEQVEPCFSEFKIETKRENLLKWVKEEVISSVKMRFGGSRSTRTSTLAPTE
jgi:hypothetical protein